jgi:hypothetical protein
VFCIPAPSAVSFCVRQLLFWSSLFIVEALCGCASSLSTMIGTLLFILA